MIRIILFSSLVLISQTLNAQRLVPYVANNEQYILNDSFDNFRGIDGEVFHDSLFVSVQYFDTLSHTAMSVLKNGFLTEVSNDWFYGGSNGYVHDLFSDDNRLYAAGRRNDSVYGVRANLAIYDNGIWNNYPSPYSSASRFYFGTVFNEKVFLFGSSNNQSNVYTFENGQYGTVDEINNMGGACVDAQVYENKLFFIKSDYSGIHFLDTLGVVHSESIPCDSLMRFSLINDQLFVSGKCNDFLFRRNANGVWVFDDMGLDFSQLNTSKLASVYFTQKGYVANLSNTFRNYGLGYHCRSYELTHQIELNNDVRKVVNFEEKEFALCFDDAGDDANIEGICTIENGWKYQDISNEYVSERAYPAFPSYTYQTLPSDINEPRSIGLGYLDNKVVYHRTPLLYGVREGSLCGVGESYLTGLNGAYSGPKANIYSNDFTQKYNRVWKVKQEDIDYHNNHWYEPNYLAPIDIIEWPGNGTVVNGEPQIIAPFHDVNGNNIYEPQFGDTPEIKGDEAIFYIVSDGREVSPYFQQNYFEDTVSNLELSVMSYVFLNSSSPALSHSFFTDYRLNLRGDIPLNEFYFGLFTDFVIGSYDDFIGCDSTRNLFFGYNSDDFDEPSSESQGYANEVPACGYRILNNPLSSAVSLNGSFNPIPGQPTSISQLYNVLQGKWKDGSPIVNPITQEQTQFMYSGEVGIPSVWNEINSGNIPSYSPIYASTFIGDLQPNSPVCISVARIVGSDTLSSGSPSVNAVYKMKQYSDEVQQYYDQYLQTADCNQLVGIDEMNEEVFGVHVYPNPAREKIIIQTTRSSISKIELFNIVGSLVHSETRLKTANTSVDISTYTSGVYSVRISLEDGRTEVKKIIVE